MKSFRRVRALRRKLLGWFHRHRRRLPWRASRRTARGRARHAYRVWVSEIMLQQTRVAAVLPYYQRFMHHFPTVRALARARIDEVLRHWAGLGYYHRARNLHRAAKEIVRRYGGCFPENYEKVLALPGIGRYTAAAVLSIAYGQPYAVLDGNVARVLARLACLDGDVHSSSYRKKLENLSERLLPRGTPGDFNQALMELGATLCLPKRPLCERCPLESACQARRRGLETVLPGKRRKPARVGVNLAVAMVERNGKMLVMRERGGFFSGLWQFPSARCEEGVSMREALQSLLREYGLRARLGEKLAEARHSVTHHDIRLHVFRARVDGALRDSRPHCRWVRFEQLRQLPVSSAMEKVARVYGQYSREVLE